jgi:hypothetical protein
MCVSACTGGGGGARALAYACASVDLLIQHATRRRIAICGLMPHYYARREFAVETDSADYYQTGSYFVFAPISYYYAAQRPTIMHAGSLLLKLYHHWNKNTFWKHKIRQTVAEQSHSFKQTCK